MTQREIDSKDEYKILLDLLARVNDANEGLSSSDISDGERLWDADWLANKFIGHALTILHLLDDTNVQALPSFPQIKVIFAVSASIDVLTRTTMESFLVFHYVFFAPITPEERNYRYWAYRAAGVAEGQNFPTITEEARQKLKDEKAELDELRGKLESNTVFQSLGGGQKRQIFEGKGQWRWKPGVNDHLSWHDIAVEAGFSEMLASHMYRYLSGHTHSSSLSVRQMTQALLNKETQQLFGASINTMNIVIANMIHEYCGLFPRAQDVLTKDLEGSNLVKQYIQIGHKLDKYMGTQVGE